MNKSVYGHIINYKIHPPITLQRGFTLIEIMIALVIIAIMSGVAVLSVGSASYSQFKGESVKISNTLEIIADEAVYTNSVITCSVKPNAFICRGYRNGEWRDINLQHLASWSWPKDITITSSLVNGRAVKDDEKIRFFPTGNIPQYSFKITDGVRNAWVDGNINGEFQVNN